MPPQQGDAACSRPIIRDSLPGVEFCHAHYWNEGTANVYHLLIFRDSNDFDQAYGVYLLDKFPFRGQTPLSEDLPRVPAEHSQDLFYYHEVDLLHELSAGKAWSWCEVRPDVIVRGLRPLFR